MRARTPWLAAAVFLVAGCEGHPLAPDSAGSATTSFAGAPASQGPSLRIEPARWLTLRSGALYDDQGRLRISRARVHALRLDDVFEMHHQDKLGRLSLRHSAPAAPGTISRAVAADDPCFFDATVWCANEEGGALGAASGGGGSGGGDGAANYDDGTLGCTNLVNNMNNAYRLYMQAQALYIEMASESPGEGGGVPGIFEGVLSAQYNTMMSYRDDYYVWRNLAIKYKCL